MCKSLSRLTGGGVELYSDSCGSVLEYDYIKTRKYENCVKIR